MRSFGCARPDRRGRAVRVCHDRSGSRETGDVAAVSFVRLSGRPGTEGNPVEDGAGMSTPVMIEARGLSKQFGSFLAVRDVTFSIPQGQVVAFLGPNGAGKTTTMRLLTGFIAPDPGTARIAGIDVQADRIKAAEHLGYLPENGPLYPDMTPHACSTSSARPAGSPAGPCGRIDAVVAHARWSPSPRSRSASSRRGTSSGSRWPRRCLHDPEVLIMDEPTSGLDPNQIRGVRS